MTFEDILTRFTGPVRRTSRGAVAHCSAHEDRHPSLQISEGKDGRVLLHCFAGCSPDAICAALGLTLKDLFPGTTSGRRRRRKAVKLKRETWRTTTRRLQDDAMDHYLRGERVLSAARSLDIAVWTPDELDRAMDAVAAAYSDMDTAQRLEDDAFVVRVNGLTEEHRLEQLRKEQRRRTHASC